MESLMCFSLVATVTWLMEQRQSKEREIVEVTS